MANCANITAEHLRSILNYDPDTGVFTWRQKTGPTAKIGAVAGGVNKRGYWYIRVGGSKQLAHRLAWLYMVGEWPTTDIDHLNLNKTDNRWDNLRAATDAQNKANSALYSNNLSGFKGVSRRPCGYKWRARIQVNKTLKNLGDFSSPELAHAAYLKAAEEFFGEFARAE